MNRRIIQILIFMLLMPHCFAAEIKPEKKSPQTKQTLTTLKTTTQKSTPTNTKTVAQQPTKQKPAPQIITAISKPVLLKKMPEQKAILAPIVEKKPAIDTTLKANPEVPIKAAKPQPKKTSGIIQNAPPRAVPSAIEKTELKKIAKEASLELQSEENEILGDLRILWQYAVENSETIKFAIYKLSDPKGDLKKADESKVKKLLKPIASITPFVAATATNPLAAGSSIIGGTFMNDVLNDDRYKKQLEKVTDADLVILAKAIEDLQNNLVTTYYEYNTSKKILKFADQNLENRRKLCESLTNAPEETVVIADTFYREALARQNQAQADLLLKRAALEQLVGNDAIILVENNKKQSK